MVLVVCYQPRPISAFVTCGKVRLSQHDVRPDGNTQRGLCGCLAMELRMYELSEYLPMLLACTQGAFGFWWDGEGVGKQGIKNCAWAWPGSQ